MTLADFFTGTRVVVLERAGSLDRARSTYLFARVVEADGVAFVGGAGPSLIQPRWLPKLEVLRHRLETAVGRELTGEDLRDFANEMLGAYLSIVSERAGARSGLLTWS